ncbi:MAG: phosphonate ABC transporter, permease protein PhnE [Betaproteobacteria bacterium]
MPDARLWHRPSSRERLARFALSLAVLAAVMVSIRSVEVIPEFLLDAPEQVQDLLVRMWPINFGFYPDGVHDALVDTLHIATLGTLIAIALALPVGVLSARPLVRSRLINLAARVILVATRSVNSLIWALLFVAIFGPGALAGTLAIACRSIGFVGKLIGEALEEAEPGPIEALRAAGAPWLSVLLHGYWPQLAPTFWSVLLLRWDINIRESSVLGLVGAGGIGMALDTALNLFQWTRVSLILLSIFVIVIAAEIIVTQIRKRVL